MRNRGSCLFLVLAGLLASCSPDAPLRPSRGPIVEDPRARADLSDESDTREVSALQRYTLSLQRVKSGSSRRVLSLRVRTTAHLRSRSTRITIAIPELQSDAALKEGRVELAGERLVSLDSGQTSEIDFEVELPQYADYSVVASASYVGPSDRELRPVQNTAAGFFEVRADSLQDGSARARGTPMAVGLRVVECEKIAAESCAARVSRRSGPLTTVASRICDPQDTECCEQFPSQCGGPPPPPVITPTSVRLMLASTLAGSALLPLRNVTVSWTGPGLAASSSLTDDGGYVNVPCNASQNGSISLTINLNNPTDLWISELVTNTAFNLTLTSQCTATATYIWGWAEASVWEYTLRSVLGVRSVFSFSRPRVEVAYTGRFDPNVSVYRRTSDFIAFHPNDVNGTRGIFVASHEFGHAVHAKLPTGIPPGNCGGAHFFHIPSNATCAFVEGFADFISAASSPSGNDFAGQTEADHWRPQCVQPATCEAIFAATLFDLIDPTSNGDPDGFPDSVQLPARHVLDVFGSCVMYFDLRSFPSGGIVTSWSSRSTQTSDLRRCLLNEGPALMGPIDATTDLWFVSRVLPWPTLTGLAFTNVLARITR